MSPEEASSLVVPFDEVHFVEVSFDEVSFDEASSLQLILFQ